MPSRIFSHREPVPSTARKGVLSDMTIAVQPNMSVRGWPTEAGSVALKRFIALENATAVERLRRAGAFIVGNTKMSELGFGLAGDTATKAVTGGHAHAVLITDTMGECRVAASMAGLWGLKPTYGLVSRFGLIGLIPSMECFGVAAGKPENLAAVMEAIAGRDEHDFSMPDIPIPDFRIKGRTSTPTVGTIKESLELLNPEETTLFRSGLARLEEMGCLMKEVTMADFDLFRTVHHIIGSVEASSSAGKYDGVRYGHRAASAKNWNDMYLKSRAESFGLLIKTYLFQGAYFQFENFGAFEDACRIRARLAKGLEELLRLVDVLALPTRRKETAVKSAESVSEIYDSFSLTLIANVAGLPALQIPGIASDGRTDLGLQLVGPRLGDPNLLSIGARLRR